MNRGHPLCLQSLVMCLGTVALVLRKGIAFRQREGNLRLAGHHAVKAVAARFVGRHSEGFTRIRAVCHVQPNRRALHADVADLSTAVVVRIEPDHAAERRRFQRANHYAAERFAHVQFAQIERNRRFVRAFRHRTRSARRRHSQHEGRAVMSDDKDDLNGFDGLGKTNDDGMHFSEEELEAAMAGFEKEFQDEEAAQQNDAPAQVPFDQPDETVNSDASSDESQDGLQSKEADAVLSEAENSLSFDDELQGLLGNRAKVAVIITRLASARLFAAFCQLSDISAQCLASPQGAVAVLRNLDGDGPEAAIKDLTTVVSGMPAVLAINRADKLEATMYLQGKVGQTFAPPVLLTSTAPFVEDLLLGITDVQGVRDSGVETVDSASLTRDDAMKILAEHTRFGRGSSSIE